MLPVYEVRPARKDKRGARIVFDCRTVDDPSMISSTNHLRSYALLDRIRNRGRRMVVALFVCLRHDDWLRDRLDQRDESGE